MVELAGTGPGRRELVRTLGYGLAATALPTFPTPPEPRSDPPVDPRDSAAQAQAAKLMLGLFADADALYGGGRTRPALKLTLVARQCPEYSDVMANLLRDNNMQSLQKLGKDSVYTSGEPVAPAIEAANDPNCTPLVGWKFTLGQGIGADFQGLPRSPPARQLAQPTTEASTPLLDTLGNATGQTLAGATTLTLDSALTTVANRPADLHRHQHLPRQAASHTDHQHSDHPSPQHRTSPRSQQQHPRTG
ncbi:hypothetical protein EDD99_5475 [Streptomyces sp. 846.5]|nr:hypothetical protein EDD99_5475 [Streptomyces sp. 846.5]